MSLNLPEDAETFLSDDHPDWSGPGVYALTLSKPDDLAAEWDAVYEERPEYWDQLEESETVVYVGAAKNVMARLEDHRDGDVRKAALLRVCEIDHLRNIWWFNTPDAAFLKESQLAMWMQNQYADMFVHQN